MAKTEFHVHNHITIDQSDIIDRLERIEEIVTNIQDVVTRIEASTTKLGEDLRRLAEQIEAGMSPEAVEALKTQLIARADALEALDAQNPEPEVPPVVEGARRKR